MEIYLMQHGDCLSKEEDQEQPLTSDGEKQIQTSARAIKKMGLKFDVVIASTKKRAFQTAKIVAEALDIPVGKIIETDLVKPSAPAMEAIDFLKQYQEQNAVLIVGHLPSLAEVASFLLTEGSKATIHFERGGIGRIDVDALPTHAGKLRWYLTPEQLRLMVS